MQRIAPYCTAHNAPAHLVLGCLPRKLGLHDQRVAHADGKGSEGHRQQGQVGGAAGGGVVRIQRLDLRRSEAGEGWGWGRGGEGMGSEHNRWVLVLVLLVVLVGQGALGWALA